MHGQGYDAPAHQGYDAQAHPGYDAQAPGPGYDAAAYRPAAHDLHTPSTDPKPSAQSS